MPRKTIPAEALVDLSRQLEPLPARSHERREAIAQAARGYGVSGHPKLKNDMLRPSMEEIGARTTLFELDGFGADKKKYLQWLLAPRSRRRGPRSTPC